MKPTHLAPCFAPAHTAGVRKAEGKGGALTRREGAGCGDQAWANFNAAGICRVRKSSVVYPGTLLLNAGGTSTHPPASLHFCWSLQLG